MAAASAPVIGIIGGSGIYEIDGLANKEWRRVHTPWGEPSDDLLFGELAGTRCVFLPRHGRGHRIPPSELNFRANIDALKRAGVTEIVSLSAVGSLREDLAPGTFVVIDQFIDRTFARVKSFFGTGLDASLTSPASFFNSSSNRAIVETALVKNAVGVSVSPTTATAVTNEVDALLQRIPTLNSAATVALATQAACTAVLGSAAVTLQ